jgi:hypothetical protein
MVRDTTGNQGLKQENERLKDDLMKAKRKNENN